MSNHLSKFSYRPELSILIPARQEPFLKDTVDDIFKNARGSVEVLVCYDGSWPVEGLDANEHLTEIHFGESIGQRTATNRLAKIARGRYLMKLDAHCSLDEGFDVKLVEFGDQAGRNVTQIPTQYNLHVFDWICSECSARTYQGARPTVCTACQHPAATFSMLKVWQKRGNRRTEGWRFDTTMHFEYWSSFRKDPRVKALPDSERQIPALTSLGACFVMQKERFEEIGGLDESHGSWGQFGVEIALKSWLSGGQHVVNRTTWFSHLFRTQPGFGFPYPISGQAQERARTYSRLLWLRDAWIGQTKSLRQLLEGFVVPPPGWFDNDGNPSPELLALKTDLYDKKSVYVSAQGKPINESNRFMRQPADNAVEPDPGGLIEAVTSGSKPEPETSAKPEPQPAGVIESICLGKICLGENSNVLVPGVASWPFDSKPSGLGVMVYYSDCRVIPVIGDAVRRQLAKIALLNDMKIVSVVIPGPYVDNWPDIGADITRYLLQKERGYQTMFEQILHGCEAAVSLGASRIYLTEHDVLYHPSHFDLFPPAGDRYYYNLNVWKVSYPDGRAVTYDTKQTSGCIANAALLAQHYRSRVEKVKTVGFSRKMGFEPGSHGRAERVDDIGSESLLSAFPNLDLRHESNLTETRWKREQFRDQRNCQNWQESDTVPGWGIVTGNRLGKILVSV